jgi:hypothetical protein
MGRPLSQQQIFLQAQLQNRDRNVGWMTAGRSSVAVYWIGLDVT